MLPLTKLIRTVDGGFRREKMVQTVTCRKSLWSDLSISADRHTQKHEQKED